MREQRRWRERRRAARRAGVALLIGTACAPARAPTAAGAASPCPVLVIAHRGASGERPEHTLAAYDLAISQGADYIEPDLVMTRDGVPVARHENEIGGTTDVASRFPARRTSKVIDGDTVRGWFTEDFTLAELRTLRARERLPFRSKAWDGQFAIPTFDEVLELAVRRSRETGRTIGVYPELKHPGYFAAIGQPLEAPVLAALARRGWRTRSAPVFLQSFEVGTLQRLRPRTGVRLVQLMAAGERPPDFRAAGDPRRYDELATPAGLREVARWADAIGVEKRMILPRDSTGRALAPTSLIADAHAAGLAVHAWTFRADSAFLAAEYGGDGAEEVRRFVALGVDGVFSDFVTPARRGSGCEASR